MTWAYGVDRDDDGDRWIYWHYAERGSDRIDLDVSSTRRSISRAEFDLHVELGFPSRAEVPNGSIGPLCLPDLIAIKEARGRVYT